MTALELADYRGLAPAIGPAEPITFFRFGTSKLNVGHVENTRPALPRKQSLKGFPQLRNVQHSRRSPQSREVVDRVMYWLNIHLPTLHYQYARTQMLSIDVGT